MNKNIHKYLPLFLLAMWKHLVLSGTLYSLVLNKQMHLYLWLQNKPSAINKYFLSIYFYENRSSSDIQSYKNQSRYCSKMYCYVIYDRFLPLILPGFLNLAGEFSMWLWNFYEKQSTKYVLICSLFNTQIAIGTCNRLYMTVPHFTCWEKMGYFCTYIFQINGIEVIRFYKFYLN